MRWFHEACFGLCFIKRKETLAGGEGDALTCEEHHDCSAEIINGCQRENVSTRGWKQKPPKMSAGSDK